MHTPADRDFLNLFLEELGRAELSAVIQATILWGLLGAGLGLALSLAAYRGFRRLRWYGATSGAGRWTQRGLGALTALVCTCLLAAAGAWEGVHRQCHQAVAGSRVGTDALPVAAGLLAEGVAWIDVAMQHGGKPEALGDPRLDNFRTGGWELDVPGFLQRLDALESGTFREMLRPLEQSLLERSPELRDGVAGKILHAAIARLGPILLGKKLSGELRQHGLEQVYVALHTRLPAEAALRGDPATIGYRDLSGFILREGLIPAVVTPIRSFARQQQIICGLIVLLACVVPAGACRLWWPAVSPDPAGLPPAP